VKAQNVVYELVDIEKNIFSGRLSGVWVAL
jgi:hypothetical protein